MNIQLATSALSYLHQHNDEFGFLIVPLNVFALVVIGEKEKMTMKNLPIYLLAYHDSFKDSREINREN